MHNIVFLRNNVDFPPLLPIVSFYNLVPLALKKLSRNFLTPAPNLLANVIRNHWDKSNTTVHVERGNHTFLK